MTRRLRQFLAALDVIEPPAGWVERAVDRFQEMTMAEIIVNLTPHTITVESCTRPDGSTGPWTVASSGVARAIEQVTPADSIAGIPTSTVLFSGVEGLPEPRPGVCYVVSTITAEAAEASGRATDDLLTPGEQVRDAAGRIIGCRSLARWTPRRSDPHYDLAALTPITTPPLPSDTDHLRRLDALLRHLGTAGRARVDILQLAEAHADAMVRRFVLEERDAETAP